jgi:hypothetical protein
MPKKVLAELFMELWNETDRCVAIIGVAWLDGLLESCLKLHLRQPMSGDEKTDKRTQTTLAEIFNAEGPLGSFSAKCKMAYLLNIIGLITFGDLKIINDIRREFAHYVKSENPHRELEKLTGRLEISLSLACRQCYLLGHEYHCTEALPQ